MIAAVLSWMLAHEPVIRLAVFASVFVVMAAWEIAAPRRALRLDRSQRWPGNLGMVTLNTLLVRAVLPAGAVAFAAWVEAHGWGLFNVWRLPSWASIALASILLDLAIYLQHVLFHAVPVLWRLHRMHHADTGFDLTTGIRFHPVEMLLSLAIKLAVIVALGAPAVAVLLFEVVLNATAMFNHANARLPERIDRAMRYVVVTPDMHRVHHSVVVAESNSNFGFNLPWWDRLFGTYRAQPDAGHERMTIGVAGLSDPAEQRFERMLTQPFRVGAREP